MALVGLLLSRKLIQLPDPLAAFSGEGGLLSVLLKTKKLKVQRTKSINFSFQLIYL